LGGGLGSIPGLPKAWGVFIVVGLLVMDDRFVTKLKEVARMVRSLITMIKSLITTNFVRRVFFAAGVTVSSSPA
jgi:hypothetical protein